MSQAGAEVLTQEAADVAERAFRRRIVQALSAGAAALLVLVAVSVLLYRRGIDSNAWIDHTYAAESKINSLSTALERLETARRAYLLSPQESVWRTYVATRADIRPRVSDLAEFISDNAVQVRNSVAVGELVERKFAEMRSTIELAHDGDLERARTNLAGLEEQRITQRLRDVTSVMLAEEARLLTLRTVVERRNARWLLAVMIIAALLLGAVASGALLLVRRYADELNRSQAALRGLNEGLEGAVRERTSDLQRANDEIQRFAYIVSHDLRSPLVNVMGFTSELETAMKPVGALLEAAEATAPAIVSSEVRLAVREDVPESIGFIRSSTRKMDRLITAILQLSREGRRNLTPEPLDMTALAKGVVDSVASLARGRGASVAVEGRLPAIVSDRLAMEQVLSNLVENAVKYLQSDRAGEVRVRGASSPGGRVLYEVEDNGRGIDPRDHERVFELFRRSGPQDTPGEGIGLAHVRALVYRLGGTIGCTSEPGRGSTFKVSLPAKLERDLGPTLS